MATRTDGRRLDGPDATGTEPTLPRTRLGGVGAVAGAVALTTLAGLPGGVAGVVVLVAWFAVGDLAAYALAYVAIGALFSSGELFAVSDPGTGLVAVAVLAVSLLPLLVGATVETGRPALVGVLAVLSATGLAIVAVTPVLAGESILVGSGALLVAVTVVSYGLHRYGMFVAGVLTDG